MRNYFSFSERILAAVPGLTLLDGRIQVDTEVHLSMIFVRQQEESHDRGNRNLVVEGLAVEVDEVRIHLDSVATSGSETVDLLEDGDGVSSAGGSDLCLLDNVLFESLCWINIASILCGGNVESDLGQVDRSIIIVCEL